MILYSMLKAQIMHNHIFFADLFLFSFMASILARRSFFLVVSGITMSYPSSFYFSFSFSFSFSRGLLLPIVLDSSLSSLDSSSTGLRFFLRLTFLLFLSFFLGSMSSFLGMMLLLTIWCATLLRNLLPKLLKVLDRIWDVALASFLYSSSFFFLVFSFSISFIFSSITFNAFRMRLPFARFQLMQVLLKVFQGRWMQYLRRQKAAKMRRKPNRKATRQVEARMMTLRGQSNDESLMRQQEKMTLVDRYCRTKMYLRRSQARSTPSLASLSRPLVPQERSSMRLKANIWRRLTQVGEQQMQERTAVIISTYFLKLKVQRTGRACPIITKMMSARRQTSGMMKFSTPSPLYISSPIDIVFTTSNVTTISPYTPNIVDDRQYSFLNRELLLLTSTPYSRLPQMRTIYRKLMISGMESTTLPMLKRESLQLQSLQSSLSRKKAATAGTTKVCTAEMRVRFMATQKIEICIQLTFFTKEQQSSCRQNRQEELSQLCSCTQLKANHEPFIQRRRWPNSRVRDVTGSTTDSASGKQSNVQPNAWIPRHIIRSSARSLVELLLLFLVGDALEGLPPIAGKSSGQHMDVSKGGFKGFIEHVGEVILKLLCALHCEEVIAASGETAELVCLIAVVSVSQFIGGVFQLQPHIAAHSSTTWVLLHMRPHLVNGIGSWLHTHISEDAVLGIEQFAESLEEEHVGTEFALILVLDAEEHVVVALGVFINQLGDGFVEVNAGIAQVIVLESDGVEDGLVEAGVDVPFAEQFCLVEGLVDELDLDVLLGGEVLLDLLLRLVPHVVLHAEIQRQLLVLLVDIPGQGVDLDLLQLLESSDFGEEGLDADVLIVLVLEEPALEGVELVLREETDVVHLVVSQHTEVEVALLQLPQVLLQRLPVLLVPEAVLQVDLVEVADHVLSLVLTVVDLLDAVEDHRHDDLVGHDAGVVQEVAVGLLDALDRRLQHVLRLGVHADANRQLYPPLRCPLEEREQPMAGWVTGCVWVLVEVADLALVDGDGQDLFFLKLIRVVLIALDDHESLVLVQPYL